MGSRRLQVLAHTPTYPPVVNAGSEQTLHALLQALQDRGHAVDVLVDGTGYPAEWEGVPITTSADRTALAARYRWADVVLTQLGARNRSMRAAARAGRPVVQLLHMGGADAHAGADRPDLLVFSAEWLRARDRSGARSVVLHPRVDAAKVTTTPGTAVTLIGLSERKGAATFAALARRCPDRELLGVRGGWGDQVVPDPIPPNVRIIDNQADVRVVYAQTRVLLLPSSHESFGRVAVEAGCSGIPTIAAPGPGVEEALGDAGLYAASDDIEAWSRHLDALDDPEVYAHHSDLARVNAKRWDFDGELADFEAELLDLVLVASRRAAGSA